MPHPRRLIGCSYPLCFGLGLIANLPLLAHADTSSRLETMKVYGTQSKLSLEAEQALTPGGVTVLDGDEYQQRNAASLADMLRYVPGVWAASGSSGDSSFYSSRGSNLDAVNYDGNGVKLLQDGLPITAADGNNHNRSVDPPSTRYAVVARGANALTYGASTLGGAIDFITPTARDSAPLSAFVSTGSHGLRQGRISAGTVAGQFDGLITAEARRWDGYRDHQLQDRQGLYANGGWQFSDTARTRLYLTHIDNDQELPGALTRAQWKDDPEQANAANESGNHLLNVKSWRIASKTELDLSDNSTLTFGVSYEEQDLYHPIVSSPFFSLLIDTEQRNTGLSLRYNRRQGDHDILAGINYGDTEVEGGNFSHDRGRATDLTTEVDNQADSLEAFIVDRWQFLPKWTAVYGAQFVEASREVRNVTVPSGDVRNPQGDYDSINPRLGLIHQLTDNIELFTNLSRLYEAPTTYELEDDARANAETLDAMQGTVLEVGSRGNHTLGQHSTWRWDIALYYGELKDEILSMDDPDAPGTSLATNIDSTIHAGLEALLGASFPLDSAASHRLEPLVSLSVNEFSFDGDPVYGDNQLPAAPGYVIKAELLYRHTSGFYAGPTLDIVDERYADFSNSYTVDSYTLLGLRIGTSQDRWDAYVEVKNLADEEYVALHSVRNIAADDDAILQPGEPRSVYAGLRFHF